MITARISAAVGMSLALHGATLAVIDRMPRGWQLEDQAAGVFGHGVLQARLRTVPVKAAARAVPAPAKSDAAARPAFGAVAPPLYLPANELDEKPLIRNHVEPQFPDGAPAAEGRVVLRLFIDESGYVDEIAVVGADAGSMFEQAAVRAFAGALFTPGRKSGTPVKSALTLELLFGAPPPIAAPKAPEGPLWQAPRRPRLNASLRKETP